MILFHGSNMNIEAIDLNKCHLYKDFGRAFYLTEDREQALVVANARVSLFGGEPVINEYEFDESKLTNDTLQFCRFEGYTEDWADFIFMHRDDNIVPPYMHGFDVVYGSDTYAALSRPDTGLYFQSTGYVMQYLMHEIRTGRMG